MPGLTAAKVRAAVEADSAKLETLGYSVKALYVDDGKTAEAVLTDALTTSGYDCIMIGAGLRVVPPYFLLFEKLINVVHRHALPGLKLPGKKNPTPHRNELIGHITGLNLQKPLKAATF